MGKVTQSFPMKASRTTLLLLGAAILPGGLLLLVPPLIKRLRGAWASRRTAARVPATPAVPLQQEP